MQHFYHIGRMLFCELPASFNITFVVELPIAVLIYQSWLN